MITSILAAIFVLGLLVFVHELGHFMAAKRMGIRVERFSLGFPPKMIGKKIGDTEYCISWIPLGGYVKMAGEHPDTEEVRGEPWEFQMKSPWARAFVIAAGPAMNILLAFVVFWGLLYILGVISVDTTTIGRVEPGSPYAEAGLAVGDRITAIDNTPVTAWEDVLKRFSTETVSQFRIQFSRNGVDTSTVVDFSGLGSIQDRLTAIQYFIDPTINLVNPGTPAYEAGMQVDDVVTEIDGHPITQWSEMVELIRNKPGQPVEIAWTRNGEPHRAVIVPEAVEELNPATGEMERIGRIGVGKEFSRSKPVGFVEAGAMAAYQAADVCVRMLVFVKQLVTGGVSTKMVGGPIFIAQLAGETARQGAERLFNFIAFLSLNLAILNLLPIPALDGGQLLILGVEGVIRRPLTLRQRLVWQQLGIAILMVIMVFVIFNDVSRILR